MLLWESETILARKCLRLFVNATSQESLSGWSLEIISSLLRLLPGK